MRGLVTRRPETGSGRSKRGDGSALSVRTLGVVTLVTALTWLLAESQTVQSRTLTIEVRLDAGGEGRALRVSPGSDWANLVEVRVNGAAANIEAFRRATRDGVTLTAGEELNAEPGVRLVELREALRSDERVSATGVSVGSASPARVEVEVASVGSRELSVAVELPEGSEAEVTRLSPASVRVAGPAGVLEGLADEAVVRVPGSVVVGLLPGQSAEGLSLPVSWRVADGRDDVEPWGVRIEPERVGLDVTLRTLLSTSVLSSVPVQVLLAPSELDRWSIELAADDRDIRDVRVSGSASAVERVTRGAFPVVAVVRLNFEELERGVTAKEAELWGLPRGVRGEADDLTVSLRVERRASAPGGG